MQSKLFQVTPRMSCFEPEHVPIKARVHGGGACKNSRSVCPAVLSCSPACGWSLSLRSLSLQTSFQIIFLELSPPGCCENGLALTAQRPLCLHTRDKRPCMHGCTPEGRGATCKFAVLQQLQFPEAISRLFAYLVAAYPSQCRRDMTLLSM